ncbi:hypothetical protein ACIRP3_34830 [Streptomyces sp. NPDC101209]|uniref:hypothetical protein n=1 Tax=Streptomyces sp. NPDC101209 TaxID=3366129 RepID=UPI0037F3B699
MLLQEQLLDVLVVGGGEQLLGRLDELDVVELDVLHRDSLPLFVFAGLFPATDEIFAGDADFRQPIKRGAELNAKRPVQPLPGSG